MKKITTIILMLGCVAFIFGAYTPPPEDESKFVTISGVVEIKADDGLILRCLISDDDSSEGDKGNHKGWTKGKHKGHSGDRAHGKGKGKHKGYNKHQHGGTSSACRFMLLNYPNVSNLEVGNLIQIGAYEIGVVNMYTVDGEVFYEILKLYSVTLQQ